MSYGGFESAVLNVGGYLRDRGWRVIVYCQLPGTGPITVDTYDGFERVLVRQPRDGITGRTHYDLVASRHAVRHHESGQVCLTFGYNSGVLGAMQALRRIPHVVNMDGMEWQRSRHGLVKRAVLLGNEVVAGRLASRLVADHPVIADYLGHRYDGSRVRMIPYGAKSVVTAPTGPIEELGLPPGGYATVICRTIPENSILDIVTAWSRRNRGVSLVLLGNYSTTDSFHRSVRAAAGPEVVFAGAIFEPNRVRALRFHSVLYLHGHTVGGTNPSLVEAMGAGNPVLARDNAYNRWVAGDAARYFSNARELDFLITELLGDARAMAALSAAARARHAAEFTD